jgi:hypothetical protein
MEADVPVRWLAGALMFAAAVAAVIFFIGIFGDEGAAAGAGRSP